MWLRDSKGEYVDVLKAKGAHGLDGLDEGADYTQYNYRRLYDWREPSTVEYFINDVSNFRSHPSVLVHFRQDTPHSSTTTYSDLGLNLLQVLSFILNSPEITGA